MRLRPTPPRLITVGIALALGIVGFVILWPVDPLVPLLDPVNSALGGVALVLILVGLLGTYGTVVSDMIGILAFVAATVLLLSRNGVPGI